MNPWKFAKLVSRKIGFTDFVYYLKENSKPIGELTHYLSVAACVKDEGRYLREWIEYHLWAGVDHFYIYDNGSTDNTWEVLAPYILRGTVTYRYWVGDRENGNQQVRMYNDAAVRYRLCTRWLAFIDADEYITLTPEGKRQFGVDDGGGLANFFRQYEKYPGVGIYWIRFDGGGREAMPESGYIIENYTRVNKDADAPMNRLIKSVVQPLQVKYCPNPHYFRFKRFKKTVNENGLAVKNHGQANTTRLIRINHYYSKSKEEYLTKIKVRKYSWKDESQQRTYNESDWAFPEWRLDDSMKEAVAALRARGVPETYGDAGLS